MRKGTDVIGKPVVTFDTGRVVDHVKDIIFDHHRNEVIGLLVDEGGWLSTARSIPMGNVRAIGGDAVLIEKRDDIKRGDEIPVVREVLDRKQGALKGLKLMTTDGRDLGTMIDLFFDEHTGRVEGYEVSGGIFSDAYSGRSFVPAPRGVRLGDEVAFVEPETAQLMEEQVGGIRGAAERVSGAVQAGATTAAERIRDTAARAGDEISTVAMSARDRARASAAAARDQLARSAAAAQQSGQQWAAEQTLDEAVGRRLRWTVMTSDRVVIGAAGQIVSSDVVARARQHELESDILQATGLTPARAAGGHAASAAGATGERLREGADDVKHAVGTAWSRVREKVSSTRQRVADEREEARIRGALGLPVTRVILDRDDHVILNTGELVTHEAVERAREADVLTSLLDSIYRTKPVFSPEALRAPEPGEASLAARGAGHDDR